MLAFQFTGRDVRLWHQQYGFDDPTKASRVRDVLRGIQALHPQPIKQAEALQLRDRHLNWRVGTDF